ncbi:hypothetical protein ALC56_02902, partial [Trachymyrmex septentrionalis]
QDIRTKLLVKYEVKNELAALSPPKLNKQLAAVLSPSMVKRDEYASHKNLCIVRLIEYYLDETRLLRPPGCNFLFISLSKSFRAVTSQTISRWIKQALKECGVNTVVFSAHSTRHASTFAAVLFELMKLMARAVGAVEEIQAMRVITF